MRSKSSSILSWWCGSRHALRLRLLDTPRQEKQPFEADAGEVDFSVGPLPNAGAKDLQRPAYFVIASVFLEMQVPKGSEIRRFFDVQDSRLD